MKLKNILSVLCFLLAATACSMEDDILNDNSTKLVPEEGSAYVSATINLGGTQTKATTGNSSAPEEYGADAITSCALFLLDANNKVVGVHSETNPESTATSKEIKFLTKVNVATKVVAVVNYNSNNSPENLLACSTYQEIQAYKEYNADYRIKVGEGTISWAGITGSASTTGTLEEAKVNIKVESKTAIVELVRFAVKYEGAGAHPTVQLKEVSLSNLKSEGGLYSEGTSFANVFSFTGNLPIDPGSYEIGYFRKNVYPNTTETKPVTLNLKFTVDGKDSPEFERSYIINRPTDKNFTNNSEHTYVQPGFWYQLSATVTVNTGKIDCAIACHVLDWDYKSIDAGDIYPNK